MPTPGWRRVHDATSSATSWLWLRGNAPPASDWSFRCDSAALHSRLRVWHQVKGRFPRLFLFRVERARLILQEGPAVRIPLPPPSSPRLHRPRCASSVEQRKADVALAQRLAHEPGTLFEVAERYSPSRIADAVAHVSQAGRTGVVLIDFSKD